MTNLMAQTLSPTIPKSRLLNIPLAVAYLAVPLGTGLCRAMGYVPLFSPYLPWALLAAIGVAHAILFRHSGDRLKKRFFFELLVVFGCVAVLYFNRELFIRQLNYAMQVIPELTPVIILGFCWLWGKTFGVPDRSAFQRYGAVLGVFCLLDLGVQLGLYHAVLGERFLGDANVLSGLLLVSLCAGLKPGPADGGLFEPDQGSTTLRALIFVGLAVCLSRTGLFAAGWIILCFGRGSRLTRIGLALGAFLLVIVTFLLPPTTSDLGRYVDYWLWAKSLGLFAHEPSLLLFGLPFGRPLPISFPLEMATIWEMVTGHSALLGVEINQISSFWLRLLLGWGGIIPVLLLGGLFTLLFRRLTRMGAGLAAALFVQGMSTPLLYDPTSGAVFGLALILAVSRLDRKLPLVGTGSAIPRSHGETDPVREWDLRPL